jgi:hypothetical protein
MVALVADRIAGHTFRAIAARHGLSKSQVHRLLRDVPIMIGPRAPKPERPAYRLELVPLPGGGYTARAVAWTS